VAADVLSSTEAHCISAAGPIGLAEVVVSTAGHPAAQGSSDAVVKTIDHSLLRVPLDAANGVVAVPDFVKSCRFGTITVHSKVVERASSCAVVTNGLLSTLTTVEVSITSASNQFFSAALSQELHLPTIVNITSIQPSQISATSGDIIQIATLNVLQAPAVLLGAKSLLHMPSIPSAHAMQWISDTELNQGFTAVQIGDSGPALPVGQIQVMEAFAVDQFMPSAAPTSGGTIVTVIGRGWGGRQAQNVVCLFGDHSVAAVTLISSVELRCVSPVSAPGLVGLRVMDVEQLHASAQQPQANFAMVQLDTGAALQPSTGTELGGTVTTVATSAILPSDLSCMFDSVNVKALRLSTGEARCIPPRHMSGNVTVNLFASTYNTDAGITKDIEFVYQPKLNISRFGPVAGPSTGGTTILVYAEGLSPHKTDSTVMSLFSQIRTDTEWRSASSVLLKAPAHAAGFAALRLIDGIYDEASVSSAVTWNFQELVTLSHLYPSSGPANSGTVITVAGSNFVKGSIVCRFDTFNTQATFVSSSEVLCTTPPLQRGPISISIANVAEEPYNVKDFSSDVLSFAVRPFNVQLNGINPTSGSQFGGTEVSLQVRHIPGQNDYFVKFGSTTFVEALALNSSTMLVLVPASNVKQTDWSQPVQLQMSYSIGGEYTGSTDFYYTSDLNTTNIYPAVAGTLGGSQLTIGLEQPFPALQSPLCRFNLHGSSSLESLEEAPLYPGAFATAVRSGTCKTITHAEGFAVVEITQNQRDYSDSGLQIELLALPQIQSINPMMGTKTSDTLVTVSGQGFIDSEGCYCKFGDMLVRANVRSSTELVCSAPPTATPQNVVVTVTNVAAEFEMPSDNSFAPSNVQYTYSAQGYVHSISPKKVPQMGGAMLEITGEFPESNLLSVAFGTVTVLTEISGRSTTVLAASMPAMAAGNVSVSISFNEGGEWINVGDQLEMLTLTNVSSVEPFQIFNPEDGISIVGSFTSLLPNDVLSCQFNSDISTLGSVTSSFRSHCIFPRTLAEGMVAVDVSYVSGNDAIAFGSALNVMVSTPAHLDRLTPATGVASARTLVTVTGSGFVAGITTCSFGSIDTPAIVQSSSQIICETPQMPLGEVVVSLGSDIHDSPLSNTLSFTVDPEFSLVYLQTSVSGYTFAGEIVTAVVGGANDGIRFSCLWNGIIYATAEKECTQGKVECVAPELPHGNATLSLHVNGFTSGSALVEFLAPINITHASPTATTVGSVTQAQLFGNNLASLPAAVISAADCSLSDISLLCMVPAKTAGYSVVELTKVPLRSATTIQIEHHKASSIEYTIPATFDRSGGTSLQVVGQHFTAESMCMFGTSAVLATVHSSTELTCETPAHFGGQSTLSIVQTSEPASTLGSVDVVFSSEMVPQQMLTSHASDGTMVRVVASGIQRDQTDSVTCRFVSTTPVYVSGSIGWMKHPRSAAHTVNCVAPAGLYGPTTVEISTNGATFKRVPEIVQFVSSSSLGSNITTVSPAVFPVGGQIQTVLRTQGQSEVHSLSCLLGSIESAVPATLQGTNMWGCSVYVLPGSASGFRLLDLAMTPADVAPEAQMDIVAATVVSTATQIEVIEAATLISMHPSRAAVSGGTVVTLTGTGFMAGQTACRFGSAESTEAVVMSSSEAVCVVPSSIMGAVEASVLTGSHPSTVSSSFVYQPDIQISASTATVTSGALVQVEASQQIMSCRLNNIVFAATMSSGSQHCRLPTMRPGTAELQVATEDEVMHHVAMIHMLASANVSSVSPSVVPVGQGHDIQVSGSGFALSTLIGCTTQQTVAWETYEFAFASSTESVLCRMAAGKKAGFAALELTLETAEYTHAGTQVLVAEPTVLVAIHPSEGVVNGGTVVTVTGENMRSSNLLCNFGNSVSQLTVLSSVEALCHAPAGLVGIVAFNLSPVDQADVGTAELSFRYMPELHMQVLPPHSVYSTGGSVVTVAISQMQLAAHTMCQSGGITFAATSMENVSGVHCFLPALTARTNHSLSVSYNGQDWTQAVEQVESIQVWNNTGMTISHGVVGSAVETSVSIIGLEALTVPIYCALNGHFTDAATLVTTSSSAACLLKSHASSFQALEVSPLKSHLLGASGLLIEFLEPATVQQVSPSAASTLGGTVVTVMGTGFVSGITQCHIGDSISVKAEVLSSNELRCSAPASMATSTKLAVSMVAGSTSNDMPFAYQKPVSILSVEPQFSTIHGGTLVTVGVAGAIRSTATPYCLFGDATFVKPVGETAAGQVQCRVPAMISGNHTLSIIMDPTSKLPAAEHTIWMANAANVSYVSHPSSSAYPAIVRAGTGSDIIVHGSGITSLSENLGFIPLLCQSAGQFAQASFIGSRCDASVSNVACAAMTAVRCTFSGLTEGFKAVDLSLSKQQVTYSEASIEAVMPGRIDSVQPSIGLVSGGTVITLSGSNLVSGRTLCRFNGVSVQAQVKSSHEANCVMPPGLVGSAIVEISTTLGSEFDEASKAVIMTYASKMQVQSFTPRVGWHSGGTRLSIAVSSGREGKPFMVRFGTIIMVTTPLQDGIATVDTVALPTGNVTFGASFNSDQLLFNDEVDLLNVLQAPNVSSVSPSYLLAAHETTLSVSGILPHSFVTGALQQQYYCHLSTSIREAPQYTISAARIVSLNTASCVVSPVGAGFRVLEIATEQAQRSTGGAQLEYLALETELHSIVPSSAHAEAQTTITLYGSGFTSKGTSACQFGTEVVSAEVLSQHEIRCHLSPTSQRGRVQVSVGLMHPSAPFQAAALSKDFDFMHQTSRLIEAPSVGTIYGGDLVEVALANVADGGTVDCHFGSVVVQSSLVKSGKAICGSVAFLEGNTTLSISLNGQDIHVPSSRPFTFIQPVNLTDSFPLVAASQRSTELIVSASGGWGATMLCSVGQSRSTAAVVSSLDSAAHFACRVSGQAAGFKAVELANIDTRVASRSGMQVQLVADATVTHLTPSTGSLSGGTVVTVSGTGFVAGRTACQFGTLSTVVADVRSSNELVCKAPAVYRGSIAFEVSNVNVQGQHLTMDSLSTSGRMFVGEAAPELLSITPRSGPQYGSTIKIDIKGNPVSSTVMCAFDAVLVEPRYNRANSQLECGVPARPVGNSTVTLVTNGDWSEADQVLYEFQPLANVSSVTPMMLATGGATANIVGAGFTSIGMSCELMSSSVIRQLEAAAPGSVPASGVSQAVTSSPTNLNCAMPAVSAGYHVLEVTLNGNDLSTSGIQVESKVVFVSEIMPSHAPSLVPGTVITVMGTGFVEHSSTCMFGEQEVVSAHVLSSSEMLCHSPYMLAGTVSFAVSTSDSEMTGDVGQYSGHRNFEFVTQQKEFILNGPLSAPTSAASYVSMTAPSAMALAPLSCRFGVITVSAVTTKHEVQCITPQHHAGPVEFSVRFNEHALVAQTFDFFTPANYSLTAAAEVAMTAASIRGGSLWTVGGSHPAAALAHGVPSCRFGLTRSEGMISAAGVSCHVPTAISAGFAAVEFAYADGHFTDSGHQIDLFEQGKITHVYPSSADARAGSTIVTVSGENFRTLGSTLWCHFGDFAPTPAVSVSSIEIRCAVPVAAPGTVQLEVTTGQSDYVGSAALDNALMFGITKSSTIQNLAPSSGSALGGSVVAVEGIRMMSSLVSAQGVTSCRFNGNLYVAASSHSESRITCLAPRLSHVVAANSSLEVSTNGVDFTSQLFKYQVMEPVNITSIRPSMGPVGGGSLVTVSGRGFQMFGGQDRHLCRFGSITVAATFISSDMLACMAPAHKAGHRTVDVISNSPEWTTSRAEFEFMEMQHTHTAFPSVGATTGGTLVTINGANFAVRAPFNAMGNAMCKWGFSRTPATVLSSTTLVCMSPNMRAGRLALSVSLNHEAQGANNLDYSPQSTTFQFSEPTEITRIFPSFGPLTGGTQISVFGSSFLPVPTLRCKFGEVTIRARYSNETLVICDAPTVSAGLYPLEISVNGEDYVQGPNYGFITTANATSLYPRSGLIYGGTAVFVTGWGFVNSSDIKCKVDRYARADVVDGVFLSSNLVMCVTRPHEAGTATIEVSSNGQDYTHNYQLFEFKRCPKGHYCPGDAEIIPSPNGTYTPLEDSRNFTLCAPGYFQPNSGQHECLACPVGFICPDYGMWAPRVCPPGQVCEDTGLMVGSELKPCPPGHYCLSGTSSSDPSGYEDADRPIPCPEGMYCSYGVVTNISQSLNFSTPQQCFSGFYCPQGSKSPQGAGMCPPGYYCPEAIAIACPAGTYCEGFGNSQPTQCQPGTYNPLQAQATCKLSEPGTISPGLGRIQPILCPAGFVCNTSGGALPAARCPRGFYCLLGTKTSNASAPSSMDVAQSKLLHRTDKPLPCPVATYCLDGVKHYIVEKGDLIKPQPCTPGAFCVEATKDATGSSCGRYDYGRPEDFVKMSWTTISPRADGTSEIIVIIDDECGGPCPPGHYCPESSAVPIPAPKGTFSKGFGNVQSTLCFAGKFAPQAASSECLPCPAGYQCPKDGVWQQEICPPGKYRSMDDTITCQMCKPGTWSSKYAVTDASFCEACPAGRVCSLEGMTTLAESQPCQQGYVCDTYTFQATSRCQPGYWCDFGTTPKHQFDNQCPQGYFCPEGTPKSQRFRNACPANYYCPTGTSSHQPEETKCPKGTISQQNSFILENCTRKCDNPDDNPTLFDEVKNQEGCLVSITSPLNRNSTAVSDTEGATQFNMAGYDFMRFTVDLRHLEAEMRYRDHWRISVYVNQSAEPLIHAPWFQSSNVTKHAVNDFNVFARTAETSFVVQLELLHGLYEDRVAGDPALALAASEGRRLLSNTPDPKYWQFNETMHAELFRPTRASWQESKSFLVLLQKSDDVSLPQNLPKSSSPEVYDECLETRKDPLLCDLTRHSDHVYFSYAGINESQPIILDEPDSRVATPELFWTQHMQGASMAVLPYVPFFSQCRGYGSNIPVFEIMENRDGCDLIPPDETVFVNQWDPFNPVAVADSCNYTFTCAYEEKVASEESRARWYELDMGEELMTLTALPYEFEKLEEGEDFFSAFIGTTKAVSVEVGEATGAGVLPREVELTVGYFQYSQTQKMLIEAEIAYGDPQSVDSNGFFADGTVEYAVTITTEAMGFGALINAFAFGVDFFMILFVMIAIMSIAIVSLFWAMQRLCTRLAHPPKFRFWAYMRVLAPSPFKGILLACIIIWTGVFMIWMLFRPYGMNFLDDYQITYDGKDDLTDADTLLVNRSGRTGLSFVILGFMFMWEGTKAFIPLDDEEEEQEEEDYDDDIFEDMSSSDDEEEEDEIPQDDELLPDEMRRSHLMFAAILEMGFLLTVVEFSYSSIFGDEIWTCLICLKIIQMFFEQLLCSYIKDVLLLCPLMVGLEMTEFVVTMGADGFIDFLMSYCVELILVLVERVYMDPALKAVGSVFPYMKVFFMRLYIDIRYRIVDPEGLEDKEEVPDPEEPEENVIEDLIDSFQVYANETTAVCLAPFLILWMLVFSKELQLVDTYGIRDSDLVYYVLFAVVIVPTQMCMDVFIQNAQELFHGWKIYEYLRYAQQRFINRTERWKLCEKEQDESIDKNLRALDQLCFSTQFYFINAVHAIGIVFVVFAVEMMILSNYNMFADPMLICILLYLLIGARFGKLFMLKCADLLGLWMVHKAEEEEMERSSLAKSLRSGSSAAGSRGSRSSRSSKGGSGAAGGVTVRMQNADLMHSFLEHNRPWMLSTISNLLTSEMLARNPPWVVKQLARVFGVTPGTGQEEEEGELIGGPKTTVAADISSDDGSDSGAEVADYGNMDHLLTTAVRQVALRWLSFVRVVDKGRQYDISTDSSEEEDIDYEPAELTDATRDIAELWLRKVALFLRLERQAKEATFLAEISSDTTSGSEDGFGHMESVNEVTAAIAMKWLMKVRAAAPELNEAGLRADISSDDSDDEDEPAIEHNYEAAVMSAKTTQIAFRWLRHIRAQITGMKGPAVMRDDISSDSGEDDEPNLGARSRPDVSSDSESGGSVMEGEAPELQEAKTKAIAYRWLRRVRREETKAAWEMETDIVEDLAPKDRMQRTKPRAKKDT
jgi:hypothetical protein